MAGWKDRQTYPNAFQVVPDDDTRFSCTAYSLYVGTAGNVRVLLSSGKEVTVKATDFQTIPLHVNKVFATGTTATDIVALCY